MARPHANQNLVMLHTLKRSVPIPCGSNTQDFDTNPFSVRGSCLKPSHQPQMNDSFIKNVKRHASRLRSSPFRSESQLKFFTSEFGTSSLTDPVVALANLLFPSIRFQVSNDLAVELFEGS